MSRLVYPEQGIYEPCSGEIGGCRNELSGAASEASFDIPSDFSYRDYLYGLGGELNRYIREVNNIDANLKNTDISFRNLSNNLENTARRMTLDTVKERNRMIV